MDSGLMMEGCIDLDNKRNSGHFGAWCVGHSFAGNQKEGKNYKEG